MSDPRNVAHDKKVAQEKEKEEQHAKTAASEEGRASDADAKNTAEQEDSAAEPAPGELEKSVAVLSKLKEMEFHSRANIETLAELTLTIEDELKQKEFSDAIGNVYSAQDGFQTKVAALIESYETKCESLKPTV